MRRFLGRALVLALVCAPAIASADPAAVRLVRRLEPFVRPHPMADARGRVPVTMKLPEGTSAATFGMREVAPGVGTVRLSPRGNWVAYERGAAPSVWSVLVFPGSPQRRDSVAGTGVVFDATGHRAADLRPAPGGSGTGPLVIRELSTGTERAFMQEGLSIASPAFTSEGQSVLFIGKAAGENATDNKKDLLRVVIYHQIAPRGD